ncbi:TadE family protein [Streptomyces sp. NPDC048442]|uniref:TadE family protein n=1 Tax=Streptomyces sp. NPDC048442 TaxID=3154823 RepID=UPI0034249A7A
MTVRLRPPRDDRGISAIQTAIIMPIVLTVFVAALQAALWGYARNLAQSAAREGVSAGRLYGAGPGAGAAQARSHLDRNAGNNLTGRAVSTAGSGPDLIRITVTGRAQSLIPGIPDLPVTAEASGEAERWTLPN